MNRQYRNAVLVLATALSGFAFPVMATSANPAALQTCINSGATSCTLAYSTYYFSKNITTNPQLINLPPWGMQTYYLPITVGTPSSPYTRSNFLLDGGGSYIYSDGSTTVGMIGVNVNVPTGTAGVKIQNFQLYNPTSYCTAPYNSNVAPPILYITQANNGSWPSSPFTSSGPYAVEVYNSVFNCGKGGHLTPAAGILANASGSSYVNDLYIHGNYFYWSTVGIGGGNVSQPFQATLGCDVLSGYNNSHSVYNPRDVIIKGNTWRDAGEGSLTLSHDRWVVVSGNSFTDDQYVTSSGPDQGGTIYIDECADTINVDSNTMVGPGGTTACPPGINPDNCICRTDGIELYGKNIEIGVNGANTISNYFFEGIGASNFYNVTIHGNTLHDNTQSQYSPYGEIKVWDIFPTGTSGAAMRQGNIIAITNNNIGNTTTQPYTWAITLCKGNTLTPINISITGNNANYGQYGNLGPQAYSSPFVLSGGTVVGVTSDQYTTWPLCPN